MNLTTTTTHGHPSFADDLALAIDLDLGDPDAIAHSATGADLDWAAAHGQRDSWHSQDELSPTEREIELCHADIMAMRLELAECREVDGYLTRHGGRADRYAGLPLGVYED